MRVWSVVYGLQGVIYRFGWKPWGLRWRGNLRGERSRYLGSMLSVVQAARVVTGSVLIIAGLIAIPLPLTPGLPLIIIGLAFGFSWHPKGLRLLRRCRVKWGRIFRKKNS